jgi:hypothetical protein
MSYRNTLELFGNENQESARLYPDTSSFLKFSKYVFLSPSFLAKQYLSEECAARNFASKYHVFWEIKTTYFGSINC